MSTRVKAGRMRFRINVLDRTVKRGSMGGEIPTEQVLYSCNADIIPLSSKETINGGQVQAFASHRIIMRYNPDHGLKSKQFITYDNRVFEIISYSDMDNLRRKLVVLVLEQVD